MLRELRELPITFFSRNGYGRTRPVLTEDAFGPVLAWNYYRVERTSDAVANLAERFRSFLEEKVVGGGLVSSVRLARGEALFFKDERLLHGRYSFMANAVAERHLRKGRILLST